MQYIDPKTDGIIVAGGDGTLLEVSQSTYWHFFLLYQHEWYPVYKDTGRPGDLTVGVLDSKSRGPGLDGSLCLSADVVYCTKAEECLITGYFWERYIY